MARLIEDAKVELTWSDGRKAKMGTLHIESDKDGLGYKVRTKISRQRIGWEFVRFGMRVMFGGRTWETKYE